jgi:hypothetical protein
VNERVAFPRASCHGEHRIRARFTDLRVEARRRVKRIRPCRRFLAVAAPVTIVVVGAENSPGVIPRLPYIAHPVAIQIDGQHWH